MYVPAPALTASSLAPVEIVTEVKEPRAPTLPVARAATSSSAPGAAHRPAGHGRRHRHRQPYRLVEVSWYGGGGSLACGGWLTARRWASPTRPCLAARA